MAAIENIEFGTIFQAHTDGTVTEIGGGAPESIEWVAGDLEGLSGWGAVTGIWGSDTVLESCIITNDRTVKFLATNYPGRVFVMVTVDAWFDEDGDALDEPAPIGWAILYRDAD